MSTVTKLLERAHSPSFLSKLKFCPRRHHIHYARGLAPAAPLDYYRLWGRLYHRAVMAVDLGYDVTTTLTQETQAVRLEPTYLSQDSLLIDRAVDEVVKQALPAYRRYLSGPMTALWTTEAVEQELHTEVEGLKLKCIPDKVVRMDGRLWTVERKTTSWDDKKWARKWHLDLQTTLECIMVEQHYGETCWGVFIEQVYVTRKRKANWPQGLPQEIHKIECKPPRPIDKPDHVKRDALEFVRGCLGELRWRYESGHEADPNPLSCGMCDLNDVCRGTASAEQVLVKL